MREKFPFTSSSLPPLFINFNERERENSNRGFSKLFSRRKHLPPRGGRGRGRGGAILTPSNALCQFKVSSGETGRREEEITRKREGGGEGTIERQSRSERETMGEEKRKRFLSTTFSSPSPTEGSVLRAPPLPIHPSTSHHDEWRLSSLFLTLGIIIQ